MSLLQVDHLTIEYQTRAGRARAVDGVCFSLNSGEVLGIAGESGCGKTTAALAIPRLLPKNARLVEGKVLFDGTDLLRVGEREMEAIRWKRIAVVFQGAMNALNPVQTIEEQIAEPIRLHSATMSRQQIKDKVSELLEWVGIPTERARYYPHEFSGGMRQRVMIAMALACQPDLVICDEPVTALDVMIQAQILSLLKDLQHQLRLSMLLISHDLSVIAETCDHIAVMYAGQVVELGTVMQVFHHPAHPYTQALLKAFPNIRGQREFVAGIPGYPPTLFALPAGCRFYERCTQRMDICYEVSPGLITTNVGSQAACHLLCGGLR